VWRKREKEEKATSVGGLQPVNWEHFDAICGKEGEKLKAKCKLCGTVYLAPSTYGTGNLKCHIGNCPRRDTRDVGQMLLSRSQGSLSASNSKFCPKKFRELLVALVIKHD
jgi:hypothetical protein